MLLGAALARAQVLNLPQLKAQHAGPIDLSGRQFFYDARTDVFIVRGHAVLRQGPTLLRAQVMQFDRKNQIAHASGNVRLSDPRVDVSASQARIDLKDETGELQNGTLNAKQQSYYLAGRKIEKLLGQHYHVLNGFFTTCGCEPGTPSWSVSASDLDVTLGGKGVVHGAKVNILGYPVLDLPYATFPAATDRQSGFLSPLFGESQQRGFQYFQPYYLAINRSSDATIALDVETNARIGPMAEYRLQNGPDDYLRVTGGFFDESIRNNPDSDIVDTQIADPHIPRDRYGLIGLLRQHLTDGLTLFADGITVSDSLYLREMDIYTLSRGYGSDFGVLRTADSDFGLEQSFENSFLRLAGTWIQDTIQPQQFALQRLPELSWSGRQNLPVGNLDLGDLGLKMGDWYLGQAYTDFDASGVNFYRAEGIDGTRVDLFPRVTMPWRWQDYLYGFVSAGARETFYDVSGHDITIFPVGSFDPLIGKNLSYNNQLTLGGLAPGGFMHRELFYGSAQVSTEIEKIYDLNWHGIEKLKHTIEPVISYDYVPVADQSALPIFDETDRVDPRSLFTYGIVSRLYGKFSSRQSSAPPVNEDTLNESDGPPGPPAGAPVGGNVAELAEFSLLQAYDPNHSLTPNGAHFGDVSAGMTVFPTSVAWLGEYTDFNPNSRQFAGQTVFLVLQPPWASIPQVRQARLGRAFAGGPYLQLNYTFVGGRNAVEQINGRLYYEMLNRVGFYYEPSYDIADGRMLYSEYGLRLKSTCDCWILDIGVNDSINPSEVQLLVQLTLGGIGSIGRNPFGRNLLMSNPYGTRRGPWQ